MIKKENVISEIFNKIFSKYQILLAITFRSIN